MTKAEKTRQFIIEQAAPILNKKGMAGTAISDIMAATKLAKGGIYGNFESKEEICLEAFNLLSEKLSASIDAHLATKSTPKEQLFALLDYHREIVLTDEGGCPLLNFGTEADDTNPAVKKCVAEAIKASQNRISQLVTRGIAAGEFRATVNAEEFAIKMFTMLEGAILTSRIFSNNYQMNVVVASLRADIQAFSI